MQPSTKSLVFQICPACKGHHEHPDECVWVPKYSSAEREREAKAFVAAIALAEAMQWLEPEV